MSVYRTTGPLVFMLSHSFSVFTNGYLGGSCKLGRCHSRETQSTAVVMDSAGSIWVTLAPMTSLLF